jgi:Mrp family chromosome partitioning ATPase
MQIISKIGDEENKLDGNLYNQYLHSHMMKKQKNKNLEEKTDQEYKKMKALLLKSYSDYKSILLVSSMPGEGTTSVVTHLAKELIEGLDRKIILIDANFRNPNLHKKLGMSREKGLINIIKDSTFSKAVKLLGDANPAKVAKSLNPSTTESVFHSPQNKKVSEFIRKAEEDFENEISQYIKKTDYKNLMALTSGMIEVSDFIFPEDGNLNLLIKCLKKRFDHILLDGAPASLYTDSLFIAPHVDGIILVVEAEKTRREVIMRVKEEFEKIHSKIIGVVFNKQRYYIPESIYKLI